MEDLTNRNDIYTTSDFNLAVFLMSKGLTLEHVSGGGVNGGKGPIRCNFSLFIPQEINIVKLLQNWESTETNIIRDVLYRSKQLKSELKRHFSNANE